MKLIPYWGQWRPTKKQRQLPLHHDLHLEIIFVHRGTISWVYDGDLVDSSPRSFVLGWPWESHGAYGTTVPQSEIYWVQLSLDQSYPQYTSSPRLHPDFHMSEPEQKRIMRPLNRKQNRAIPGSLLACEIMTQLVNELIERKKMLPERVRSMTQLLLQELAQGASNPDRTRSDSAPSPAQVKTFLNSLPEHCGEPWTLESMAEACGLGRTQFSAIASSMTGDTPLRLLNRIRIRRARDLLATTHHSATRIGFDCGFNSSQYFARVFREFTGESPTSFRKNKAANDPLKSF